MSTRNVLLSVGPLFSTRIKGEYEVDQLLFPKNTKKAQNFYVKQNIGDVLVKEVICDAGNKYSDFSVGDFLRLMDILIIFW